MAGFLGSGDLYYDRVVGGVSQGWLRFGNATKFEIKENSELKERISKKRATYGQSLNSVYVKKPAEISIALDDLDKDNLALAFLGDTSLVTVTGATATSEAQTVVTLDKYIQLDFYGVTTGTIVVKDVTDVTTYALGVDYNIIDLEMGLIEILSGATIVATDVLHITYDYGTKAANKVTGGTNSSIKVALLLNGENFADQSKAMVNVWEAELSPQTGVDFLADDFASIELNGALNTPSTKASPYEIETDVTYTV